jgi:hypothetical protein
MPSITFLNTSNYGYPEIYYFYDQYFAKKINDS